MGSRHRDGVDGGGIVAADRRTHAEHGMVGALRKFLPEDGAISAMFRGGVALASKDIEVILQLLVDAEMKMFDGLPTPVIFMQNVITDLLLGLGMKDALRIFADHVRKRYDAEPGFITMNMPMLLDVLDDVGIENPIVCSNINKLGFRMSGGIDSSWPLRTNGESKASANR